MRRQVCAVQLKEYGWFNLAIKADTLQKYRVD